jgi:tetratricopeptide (TPR) repeat protein
MESTEKITICLNMIVKNESKIITRLFDSVLSIIDCYCICDTGSTDNTKEIITEYFNEKNIPGKIFYLPFTNFGFNRTKALQEAKNMATYILLLDADMTLTIKSDFNKSSLQKDAYDIQQGNSTFKYLNTRLVLSSLDIKCVGPTHEYYDLPKGTTKGSLNNIFINDIGDGGCKDNKFSRDIRLLKEGLIKEPENGRYYFYLANSYYNSNLIDKAIEMYKKRIEVGGWIEEVWYSYYRLGSCYQKKGENEKAIFTWLEGYNHYPKRVENIYEIVKYYRIHSKHQLAYFFYKLGASIPLPKDNVLFLHHDVYDYLFDYEFFICYYYLENKNAYSTDLIHKIFYKLLNYKYQVSNILSNYKFYIKKLEGKKIPINIECPDNYVSSTPSIVKYNNGYMVNVRMINVVYDNGKYLLQEKNEVTKNRTLIMDENFEIKESRDIDDNEKYTNIDNPNRLFFGAQDIRLHNFENSIIYTGIISYTKNDEKMIGVAFGNYGSNNQLIPSPNNRKCEKNWTLFHTADTLHCVYEWHPLTICNLKNNTLSIIKKIKTPPFFELIRGSTNGYLVEKNNEIWFVCHIVSHENVRHYMHIIIILDSRTFEIKSSTYPFTFENIPIEYCLGCIVSDTNVILTYSTNDSTSNILCVPKKNLKIVHY